MFFLIQSPENSTHSNEKYVNVTALVIRLLLTEFFLSVWLLGEHIIRMYIYIF